MSRIDVFVAPRPNPALINIMTLVNRIVMLRGVPGFRDILPFNRLAGLRGVANVRHIDFPDADPSAAAGQLRYRQGHLSSRPIIPSSSPTG